MNAETRTCQNCKQPFVIEPDDFSFYEKVGVPPPTFCPACRFQRRLLFRNERNYHRRNCDLCKKSIISVYPADAPFPVYCIKCWWSDTWDPYSYGRDFDFSRPFFKQYKELQNTVPALSIMNDDGVGSVNCEYTYDCAFSKNCYMHVCGWYVENGLYMYDVNHAKDIMDCWNVNNSELMYESVNCDKCYNCKFCDLCFDSNNCAFGYDLRGCSNCVMCVGLRNKQYHILNQPYSKEEYEKKLEALNLGNRIGLAQCEKALEEFSLKFPRKYAYILRSVHSSGFFLIDAKMSKSCFYAFTQIENSSYIVVNDGAKDTYDCNNTGNPELCYESVTPDNSRGNKFSIFCWKCTEAEYSNNCHSCVNVFGSTGIKHGSYVILNKRYSKEEFIPLREKIIEHMKKTGEWGEFFPYSLSPFAYNQTAAMEWYPLTRDEAIARGYRWKDDEKRGYVPTKTADQLPKTIGEVGESYLNEVIACEHIGKCNERCTDAFRIVPEELSLYRKFNIPLPTLCPNCRHYARLKKRNPPQLWMRRCTCVGAQSANGVYKNTVAHPHGASACPNEFETSYAPERPEIVYCEQCYNAEVV